MQLEQTDEETASVRVPTARETDTGTHVQQARTQPLHLGDIAGPQEAVTFGYRVSEAFIVTLCLAIITTATRILFSVVASIFANNFLTSRENLPNFVGGVSFVTTAIASLVIGVGVGLVANRRTMVGSLVVANIVTAIGWQTFMTLSYPQLLKPEIQLMPAMLVSSLFGVLTITLTDIAVALYVARKIRKKS